MNGFCDDCGKYSHSLEEDQSIGVIMRCPKCFDRLDQQYLGDMKADALFRERIEFGEIDDYAGDFARE